MNLAVDAAQEITDGRSLGLKDGLGDQCAAEIEDGGGNGCLMNVESDILAVSYGAPPVSRLVFSDSKLPYRGCAFSI